MSSITLHAVTPMEAEQFARTHNFAPGDVAAVIEMDCGTRLPAITIEVADWAERPSISKVGGDSINGYEVYLPMSQTQRDKLAAEELDRQHYVGIHPHRRA